MTNEKRLVIDVQNPTAVGQVASVRKAKEQLKGMKTSEIIAQLAGHLDAIEKNEPDAMDLLTACLGEISARQRNSPRRFNTVEEEAGYIILRWFCYNTTKEAVAVIRKALGATDAVVNAIVSEDGPAVGARMNHLKEV